MVYVIIFGLLFLLDDFSTFTWVDWLLFVAAISYVIHYFTPQQRALRSWYKYKHGS